MSNHQNKTVKPLNVQNEAKTF